MAHEIAHDKLGHARKKWRKFYDYGRIGRGHVFLLRWALLNHIINPTITNNLQQDPVSARCGSDGIRSLCSRFDMSIERQTAIMQKIEKYSNRGGGFWATHPSWEN